MPRRRSCASETRAITPLRPMGRDRSSGGPAKKLSCGLRCTTREGDETRRGARHPRAQRRWTSAVRRWPWIRRTTQMVEFVRGRRFLYRVDDRPRTQCSRLQTARYPRLVRRAGVECRAPRSADERHERIDREGTRRRLCGACLRRPGGAEDFTTPTSLARTFVQSIRAPRKAFVTIPEGGHFAVFMKRDAFLHELVARMLPAIAGRGLSGTPGSASRQ